MSCPASWNTRRLRWLREKHPGGAASIAADHKALRAEIEKPLAKFRESLALLAEEKGADA